MILTYLTDQHQCSSCRWLFINWFCGLPHTWMFENSFIYPCYHLIVKITNRWDSPCAIYISNMVGLLKFMSLAFWTFLPFFPVCGPFLRTYSYSRKVQGTALARWTVLLYFCTSRYLVSYPWDCSHYPPSYFHP